MTNDRGTVGETAIPKGTCPDCRGTVLPVPT